MVLALLSDLLQGVFSSIAVASPCLSSCLAACSCSVPSPPPLCSTPPRSSARPERERGISMEEMMRGASTRKELYSAPCQFYWDFLSQYSLGWQVNGTSPAWSPM